MTVTARNPARQDLARILQSSAQVLAAVESGRSLSAALEQQRSPNRAATRALSVHAMRYWGLAQAWRNQLVRRRVPSDALHSLVALSLLLLDLAMMQADAASPASWQAPISPE